MEVPGPKTDPTNEGAEISNDPSASQTAGKGLQPMTVQNEPVVSFPHLPSDFQASPSSIDEITEDPVNEKRGRLIQGSGSGKSLVPYLFTS